MNARTIDVSRQFAVYGSITVDASLWDNVTVQIVPPGSGTIYPYGTSSVNIPPYGNYGNAALATNFRPIQVTNLESGSAVSSFSAGTAGHYKAEVRDKYLKFGGGGVTVYQILLHYQRIQ